jgi:phosphomannomutase
VTASHNPPGDNGIKCFADGEEYDADAEARIEDRVAAGTDVADWQSWAGTERVETLDSYREAVLAYAGTFGDSPEGVTVAVDCGNGTASLATPQVLSALGADVCTLEANVDGHFPARESKPTSASLAALRSLVPRVGADLGIGHDGDGDRIVIVDADGDVVHEDTVVAILAGAYVEDHAAESPVVMTTPNASSRVDERVRAAGGRTERVRLGALHEGIAAVDGPMAFAAEPWKHVHPGLGSWIDGVASAAVFVRLVAEAGLDALRDPVTERPYRKVSVDCPDGAKATVMAHLATCRGGRPRVAFPDATPSTEYGIRLSFEDGSWVLVRSSGTEPYVRVYAESEDVDDLVGAVLDEVDAVVSRVS